MVAAGAPPLAACARSCNRWDGSASGVPSATSACCVRVEDGPSSVPAMQGAATGSKRLSLAYSTGKEVLQEAVAVDGDVRVVHEEL